MVANPNSNLVFDFPDPTPRFEFDDSPTKNKNKHKPNNNTPVPNNKKFGGKRFGKFSTKKLASRGIGGGGGARGEKEDDTNNELDETNDTSATSLNSSLNSSTTTNNNSPQQPSSLRRNNSGDKAAGLNFTLADSNTNNSSSTKLNLLPSIGSTSLHKRNPSIASGYVSEVSEFSFDRVTVTTNDTDGMMTGQSSNVSWNFMEDTLLGQAGGLQPAAVGVGGGGVGKNNNYSSSVGCVPYTGGGGSLVNGVGAEGKNHTPTTRGASNQAAVLTNSQQTKKHVNVVGGGKARRTQSSSTFDNVSLDTEEEDELNLQIPFNGEMKMIPGIRPSDDSVISEISERSSSRRTQSHVGERAVKALLREGMVNAKLRDSGMLVDPLPSSEESPRSHQQEGQMMNINNNKNDGTTKSTTSSKRSSNNNLFLEDIQNNYYKFKTSRNNGLKEGRSILSSIIEDVQFCGLYFCGIDTTTTEDDEALMQKKANNKGGTYEETLKMKKEGRKKETEDTFLGKVISCVPKTMCGVDTEEHATVFCGGGR